MSNTTATTKAPTTKAPTTLADLAPGTVVAFTKDLTFMGARWANRPMGAHFILGEQTSSGYMTMAFNTFTGRWDALMNDAWIMRDLRVIGRIEESEED